MKIEDSNVRSINAKGHLSVGRAELVLEDNEDVYQLYRLISTDDLITDAYDRRSRHEKIDMHVTELPIDYDFYVLTVKGTLAKEKGSVPAGKRHKLAIDEKTSLSLKKPRWDVLALKFLRNARLRASVGPIGVVSIQEGMSEVHLIAESWTLSFTTPTHDEDQNHFFDGLSAVFLSKIDIDHVDHVIVAGHGNTQKNFYNYLFGKASKEKPKVNGVHKNKFIMVETPAARVSLKSILLNSVVTRNLKNQSRRSLEEIESLERYQKMVRQNSELTCDNEEEILQMPDNIKELLVSDENIRNVDRRFMYIGLVECLEERKITFLSKFHPWHAELGPSGIAAILFSNVRGGHE